MSKETSDEYELTVNEVDQGNTGPTNEHEEELLKQAFGAPDKYGFYGVPKDE